MVISVDDVDESKSVFVFKYQELQQDTGILIDNKQHDQSYMGFYGEGVQMIDSDLIVSLIDWFNTHVKTDLRQEHTVQIDAIIDGTVLNKNNKTVH